MQKLYALLTGIAVGAFFTFIKVTIPAPPTLAGILSIFGIYLGYITVLFLLKVKNLWKI